MLLKEKFHFKWLDYGDRNSAYFHRVLKLRKINKLLNSLSINGVHKHDHLQIREHKVSYYEDLFSHHVSGQLDEGLIG